MGSWFDVVELPPLVPADEAPVYKQPKVVIGTSRVRRWQWVAFTNSARSDGLVLHHWRRAGDDESDEDYYFARFNKVSILLTTSTIPPIAAEGDFVYFGISTRILKCTYRIDSLAMCFADISPPHDRAARGSAHP
ncbi:unnamed protein product [Dibothriocephalus latus]|uniref:Uncharacterized protein n=1 Tax=Dibothriocephalus latus TaxID=60516 RepID=A0A3P7NBJ3_DIBLA|nr:unnamed protein product [Dibothriocephalus latus]